MASVDSYEVEKEQHYYSHHLTYRMANEMGIVLLLDAETDFLTSSQNRTVSKLGIVLVVMQ